LLAPLTEVLLVLCLTVHLLRTADARKLEAKVMSGRHHR
jgi:hypothetical protein